MTKNDLGRPNKHEVVSLADQLLLHVFNIPAPIKMIKRAAKLRKFAEQSGVTLARLCLEIDPCGSLACPICRRRDQLSFIRDNGAALIAAVRKRSTDFEAWKSVTIIPEAGRTEVGKEPRSGLKKLMESAARKLRACAPGAVGRFYIDLSWNIDISSHEHWQWHIHGLISEISKEQERAVRAAFSWRSEEYIKPAVFKRIREPIGFLAYAAKPNFSCRVDIVDDSGNRNTRKKGLTRSQELLVGRAVCKYKVKQRRFKIGFM